MTLRSALRRILVSTPFTTAERLIPDNAVESVRRALFPMTQDEVRRVLAGLIAAQVPFVLAGGWGVDALATGQGGRKGGRKGGREWGRRRGRRHLDVDVIAAPEVLATMLAALADLGYRQPAEDWDGGWWAPHKLVLVSDGGGRIDVLILAADQWEPLLRRAVELLGHDVDRAPVPGHVGGLTVPCLPAALQLATHDGFEMNRHQRADRRVLAELTRR